MRKSRTIFIGDIHGCYNELKLLLEKLELQENDKVYLTGDIINKGPKSYKVLKYVYKNRDKIKTIKGNHEINFLRWLNGENYNSDGVFEKLKGKIENKNKECLINFIRNLPLYIEEENFLLIHGGLDLNKKLEQHNENEITRIREIDGTLWYKKYTGNKKIIYGHNAIDGLQIQGNTVGLDSGCVYGKSLTAYILETGEVISQNALDNYINVYK